MVGCVHIVHTACYRHEWLVMVISLDESWYSGDGVELVMWLWYHVVVDRASLLQACRLAIVNIRMLSHYYLRQLVIC